jgi:hypothetical protein
MPLSTTKEASDAPEAIDDNSLEAASITVRMEESEGGAAFEVESAAAPAPKPNAKKSRAKKRPIKEMDASSDEEPEYIPKKSRSRSIPFKEAVGLE